MINTKTLIPHLRAFTWNSAFLANLMTAACCALAVWLNHSFGSLVFKVPVPWVFILPVGLFLSMPGCWLVFSAGVRGKLPVDYRTAKAKLGTPSDAE